MDPAVRRIDAENDAYQILKALKENRRQRAERGEAFVEGIECIKQALGSNLAKLRRAIVCGREGLSDWAKGLIASGRFEEILDLTPPLYRALADKAEPSELMATFSYRRLSLDDFRGLERPLALILDRPSDLGNLGSIIRSANAFGVDLVLTIGHCVDFLDSKAIRASLGAVFRTPLIHVESLAELESWLEGMKASSDMRVIGTDSKGEIELGRAGLSRPLALILGNEATGMSQKLKALADACVRIPMRGQVNSLNLACAASILLWEAGRD